MDSKLGEKRELWMVSDEITAEVEVMEGGREESLRWNEVDGAKQKLVPETS